MDLTLDLQLTVMARAMRDVVLPALAQADSKVTEQAGLVLAMIEMIREHAPLLQRFETVELEGLTRLGSAIVAAGPAHNPLLEDLDHVVARADGHIGARSSSDGDALQLIAELRAVIGSLAASDLSHAPDGPTRIGRLILDAAGRQAITERAWLARTGFDPNPSALPPIGDILARPSPV